MEANYWTGLLRTRLGRRRAVAAAGSSLAGAAFLAACGGGSKSGSKAAETSRLLTRPVDTTKQAKRGGTFALTTTMGPTNWEPFQNQQGSSLRNGMLLQRITTKKPGLLTEP